MQNRPSLLLVALLLGCGSTGSGNDGTDLDATTDGSKADATDGGDGSLVIDSTDPDAGELGCSADLRKVIDAVGTVVTTCPDAQGCSKGKCIPACDAAAASHGNVGCDFFAPTPPAYPPALPPCFAVFIANTWPLPAKLTVGRDTAAYDATTFARIPEDGKTPDLWKAVPPEGIPKDQVAVLFLSSDPKAIMPENGVR